MSAEPHLSEPAKTPRGGWLDEKEREAWLAFVAGTQSVMTELDRQLLADAGIPQSWYAVLVVLAQAPGHELAQGVVAQRASFSLSRLSHTTTRLEGRGWVRRVPHPTDRRVTNVRLTDAGAHALGQMAPRHVEEVRRRFFDRLDRDQLEALTEAFSAIRGEPADG